MRGSLLLDGVYRGSSHQPGDIVALPPPETEDVARVLGETARRIRRRLEALADGRLAYQLETPGRDGTTHVVMERRELLERLAPRIPPPGAHQVRYHGVLAPCASARDRVVPAGPSTTANDRAKIDRPESDAPATGCIDEAEQVATGAVLTSSSSYESSPDRSDPLARRIA